MNHLLGEEPVRCPFCGEPITILVDASAGAQSYIEDCQVCCRPMQVTIVVEDDVVDSVQVDRAS